MYLADTTVLSRTKYPEICGKMEEFLRLSKALYNAALFRIRQVFTGWDKEKRTFNEEEVFGEIRAMQAVYPHVKVGRVLSYRALDAIMRANGNPDFFAGLPMQTAQRVLKEAVTVFKAWLSSLKEFRHAPEKYTGRPCMPKYLKGDRHTIYISNQDAVLYPVYREGGCAGRSVTARRDCREHTGMGLKLPHIKERIFLRHISADNILKEVQVRPYYGKLLLVLVLETEDLPAGGEKPHLAGIDLGTDNIAAIVSTDHASRIYKGGAVLSANRYFQKKKAQAVGTITKGTARKHADSARLRRLSLHHDCFMKDMMHKVSTDIVRRHGSEPGLEAGDGHGEGEQPELYGDPSRGAEEDDPVQSGESRDPHHRAGGVLYLEGGHHGHGPYAGIRKRGWKTGVLRETHKAGLVCLQRRIYRQRGLQRSSEHPQKSSTGGMERNGGLPFPG